MKTPKPTAADRDRKQPDSRGNPPAPFFYLGDIVDGHGVIHSRDKRARYVVGFGGAFRRVA